MVKIIAIDGLDGSGKSTFCRKYVSYLKDLNLHTRKNEKVYIESFHLPDYETPTGLKIKENLKSGNINYHENAFMNMLNMKEFFAKHKERWDNNKNTIVVLDRYILSTLLYSLPFIDEKDLFYMEFKNKQLEYALPNPDLQVYFYCDKFIQEERLQRRSNLEVFEKNKILNKIHDHSRFINKSFSNKHTEVITLPSHFLDNKYWYEINNEENLINFIGRNQSLEFQKVYFGLLNNRLYDLLWEKINIPAANISEDKINMIAVSNHNMYNYDIRSV